MMLRLKKLACSLMLILPLSFLLTCAQQEDPAKMKIQQLISDGKIALGNSDYDGAMNAFGTVLTEYDPEYPDAMYGYALSATVKQLAGMDDQFKSLIDMVFELLPTITTSKTPQKLTPQATSSGINAIVESLVDDTFLDAIDALFPYWDKLKQHPEFSMTFDHVPGQIGVSPYLVYKADLGGVHDIGTVYFLSGLARMARALSYFAYSVNLDLTASLPKLLEKFLPMLTNPEGFTITVDRDFILEILATLINNSPNFMTLEPAAGKERLVAAADQMALALQDLLNCLDSISQEKDVQSNHVIGYASEGNKSYLVFHVTVDGVFKEIPIEFSSQMQNSLQNLISSFQSCADGNCPGGGVRASWAQDFAPFIGLIVQAALQSGLIDPVLAFALPMLQTYIGEETVAMINQMMGTVKELAKSGVISGAITTIIPDAIQFDFGKLTHAPPKKYFRLILPAVVTDQDGKDKLLIEYECTDLPANSFWCPYPETVTSTAHFVGYPFEIPDDGVQNTLPYLSSEDPSIDGFIYMNLSSLDASFANEWHKPSSYEFNYFVGKVVGGLLGGLGDITTSAPSAPTLTRRPPAD